MIKQQLKKDLKKVVEDLGSKATDIVCDIPQNPSFGDYTSNIALQLSKLNSENGKQTSLEIANKIVDRLQVTGNSKEYLEKIEIKGPGFLNFFIKDIFLVKDLAEILKQKEDFGKSNLGEGKSARVEYVSANPTGPLHFGNARGGPIGEVLSNVLEFSGYKVLREYLDNDKGNQILELGKTLAVRAGLISFLEEELIYKGEYVKELAEKIKPKIDKDLKEQELIEKAGELGVKILFKEIIGDCKDMGINYDLVVHESELQKQAPVILEQLEKKGVLKKSEGALWFAPKSEFLKDREAVVIKSDGSYTYFMADVVYHMEKFKSGYDLIIDVFGSNTSGHVPKLQALAEVSGFDLASFKVILYQFVRIKRGQEVVKMSKRSGNFVTTREVLDEVGKDALRFFILMFDSNTHLDFDLEIAKQQSNKNPVYYVKYAHARMSNILNKADQADQLRKVYPCEAKLNHPTELVLIKHLTQFPDLVEEIAETYQVNKLTTYATRLADLFHKFYESCRVLNAETEDLKESRLILVAASKTVLGNTLKIMGIEAPERM